MTNTAPQLKNSSETDESLKTPTSPKINSKYKRNIVKCFYVKETASGKKILSPDEVYAH